MEGQLTDSELRNTESLKTIETLKMEFQAYRESMIPPVMLA